jgi:hypothetical protein
MAVNLGNKVGGDEGSDISVDVGEGYINLLLVGGVAHDEVESSAVAEGEEEVEKSTCSLGSL